MRAEEAKIVQEKAAKIKEWVTLKLAEVSPALFPGGERGMGMRVGLPRPRPCSASCPWRGLDWPSLS